MKLRRAFTRNIKPAHCTTASTCILLPIDIYLSAALLPALKTISLPDPIVEESFCNVKTFDLAPKVVLFPVTLTCKDVSAEKKAVLIPTLLCKNKVLLSPCSNFRSLVPVILPSVLPVPPFATGSVSLTCDASEMLIFEYVIAVTRP